MKTTKTITIDYELWNLLLLKSDNCSGTINELVRAYLNTTPTTDETKELKSEIIRLQAEIGKKNEIIKKKEEEAEKKIPKFKWVEPIY